MGQEKNRENFRIERGMWGGEWYNTQVYFMVKGVQYGGKGRGEIKLEACRGVWMGCYVR